MTYPTFFINDSSIVGQIVAAMTTNATGSDFLTFFAIVIGLIAICLMFRIPIEITAIVILPITLTLMAYNGSFFPFGAILLFYLAVILTKYFFFISR